MVVISMVVTLCHLLQCPRATRLVSAKKQSYGGAEAWGECDWCSSGGVKGVKGTAYHIRRQGGVVRTPPGKCLVNVACKKRKHGTL